VTGPPGETRARTEAQGSRPQRWTTRTLLEWMTGAFREKDIDSPRLCAELLVAHVIGCERLRLYTEADRPASELERDHLRSLVSRALKHEPVQYLVGEGWFFSLPFKVDRRVLIPRPSSESIVENLLQTFRAEPGLAPGGSAVIADICTGSGCLAIALLKNLPNARAIAADLSTEALEVAALNAEKHRVSDRIELLSGDLLAPLETHPAAHSLHAIVSNPPYIPDHEWETVAPNVKDFEPESALRAGDDGMKFVAPLIERAPAMLRPDGVLLVEIASCTAEDTLKQARQNKMLRDARIIDDWEGLPRVLSARRA